MPKHVLIHNLNNAGSSPIRASYCSSYLCRLRGLTFRASLQPDEGLLLVQTRDSRVDSSIHMFFVPMDLAVIWINSAMQVVDVQLARAWRPAYWPKRPARYVLEASPEQLQAFRSGDQVRFEEANPV